MGVPQLSKCPLDSLRAENTWAASDKKVVMASNQAQRTEHQHFGSGDPKDESWPSPLVVNDPEEGPSSLSLGFLCAKMDAEELLKDLPAGDMAECVFGVWLWACEGALVSSLLKRGLLPSQPSQLLTFLRLSLDGATSRKPSLTALLCHLSC